MPVKCPYCQFFFWTNHITIVSLGDNIKYRDTFLFDYDIENIFKLSWYRKIAIKKIYEDFLSQKLHGNEIRTVFSAFRSEKQKRTTLEVHTHYANEFVIYCDACRKAIMREWKNK